MALHKDAVLGDAHFAHKWEYADAAARAAATGFTSTDVGKLARQLDNNSLHMLTATTPTWVATGGAAIGDALMAQPLSQFAATTSLQLKGVISDETGSGALVFATSPALVTPTGIVKNDVGLGNVDNTSDVNKPVSTATAAAITAATVGLWDDRGNFDASVNTYPTTGGSGTASAILKGDIWTVSVVAVSGPLTGYPLGATVRALADTPGQTAGNWALITGGGTPANIQITDLNKGTATALQLYRCNAAGTAIEGYTLLLLAMQDDPTYWL